MDTNSHPGGEAGAQKLVVIRGEAVCKRLAAAGNEVLVTYHSNRSAAERVHEGLPAGTSLGIGHMDVADRASVAHLRKTASSAAGRIDGVVYAPGVDIAQPHAADASGEEWRSVIGVELMGFINVIREFVPAFRVQRYGTLVSIVTFANYSFPSGDALSSVPKAGIEALTRAVAKEEGRNGIRANCVAPGIINAGLGAKFQRDLYDCRVWERRKLQVPLRRFGEAHEVADAVAFLASDRARYITGTTLLVDGGLHL